MPTQKKIDIVADLTEKLTKAKSVVFTDYRGLQTPQLENLRRKVEEGGGAFGITKNTLLQLALQRVKYSPPLANQNSKLKGPTATLFAFTDEVAPIKALVNFAKEWELPKIKLGVLGKDFIDAEKVKELANLPGKNELFAKLAREMQVPTYNLVNVLKSNLRNLVYVIKALSEQKQSKGGDQNDK